MQTKPNSPDKQVITQPKNAVKVATPDVVLFDDQVVGAEVMADLIFQDIGGQEIINIARSDMINGQNVTYQPIKNITSLFYQYNPQNILALQKVDKDYFKNFPIKLSDRLPEWPYLEIDGQGNLVIKVINMLSSESIEVEVINKVTVLSDTIYSEENL